MRKHHLRILLSMKILRPQITEVLSQWVEGGAQESRFLRSTRGDSARGGPLQGACQWGPLFSTRHSGGPFGGNSLPHEFTILIHMLDFKKATYLLNWHCDTYKTRARTEQESNFTLDIFTCLTPKWSAFSWETTVSGYWFNHNRFYCSGICRTHPDSLLPPGQSFPQLTCIMIT